LFCCLFIWLPCIATVVEHIACICESSGDLDSLPEASDCRVPTLKDSKCLLYQSTTS
jgi:hypothetical protein